MLKELIHELGEFYLTCSTHLFENFAQAGIAHWWEDKPNAPKGGAIFTYYDAEKTCLRLMPNAPKFFDAAVRNNLISHASALDLAHELLTTLGVLLDGYSGFFAAEMKNSPLRQSIRYASEPQARSILAAHQNLGPDELSAVLPWPLMPSLHFRLGNFSPAGVQGDYIQEASQSPLRLMSIALDIVTWGVGSNISFESLVRRLAWMRNRRRSRLATDDEGNFGLQKILIPCFTAGFQGITFGLFRSLPPDLEHFAISQLQQFSASIGEFAARQREHNAALALTNASTLVEYAKAFIKILPPVEHALFATRGEKVGLKLEREENYLAGYRLLKGDELNAAFIDPANALLSAADDGGPRVYVKFPVDAEALSPVFTLLRLRPRIVELPSPATAEGIQALSRAELAYLSHGLRRQIQDGRGALAASKKLFLVEAALQDFDVGETTLTNSKARQYMERILGKPNFGYQVAGKAARKFEEDIKKLVPQRFLFETVSAHSVRIRWRPASEPSTSSGRAGQLRG